MGWQMEGSGAYAVAVARTLPAGGRSWRKTLRALPTADRTRVLEEYSRGVADAMLKKRGRLRRENVRFGIDRIACDHEHRRPIVPLKHTPWDRATPAAHSLDVPPARSTTGSNLTTNGRAQPRSGGTYYEGMRRSDHGVVFNRRAVMREPTSAADYSNCRGWAGCVRLSAARFARSLTPRAPLEA